MRAGDLAPPTVPAHPIPPGAPIAGWPGQLHVAIEYLPQGAYTWDDADPTVVWDDPDPDRLVWDDVAVGSGFTDVVCDFQALTIEPGEPDELGLFPPVELTVSLANPDGRYSIWAADGRLTYWAPGRRIAVWVTVAGVNVWLFAGRMASWTRAPGPAVEIVAYDGLAALAQPVGIDWTPGTAGQKPLARIQAIAAATGYTDPIGGDPGQFTLATVAGDDAPLEAAQRAALSDGGIFAGDADGKLIYRDRLWRAGRADAPDVPAFSDNVCPVVAGYPTVVWDPVEAADDIGLFTRVELVNLAGQTAVAQLPAGATAQWWTGAQYRLTHPDPDLWQTAGDGTTLAAYLLAQTSTPGMAVRSFALHLLSPSVRDRWARLLDLRRGDRIEWVSDYDDPTGAPARLDMLAIIVGVGHEISPDGWVMTVTGARTVEPFPVQLWDQSAYTWDDPNPANVWRY